MFIIDRFENDWVIVEFDRKTFNVQRSLFPAGAKEGDVINIKIIVDSKATASRKKSIKDLADTFFED